MAVKEYFGQPSLVENFFIPVKNIPYIHTQCLKPDTVNVKRYGNSVPLLIYIIAETLFHSGETTSADADPAQNLNADRDPDVNRMRIRILDPGLSIKSFGDITHEYIYIF